MSQSITDTPIEPLPTHEENQAGLRGNAVLWDAAIRSHPAYLAAPADGSQDALVADTINIAAAPGPDQPVAVEAIMGFLRAEGVWLKIRAAEQTSAAAAAALDLAQDVRTVTVRLDLPLVKKLLPQLVTDGLIKQEHLDAIMAMGRTTIPGWKAIGAPCPINEHDVARARAGV